MISLHPTRLNAVIARAIDGNKFKIQWFHKNYLDHVYAVSDDNGDFIEHYRYTAFGEVTIYDENGNIQQSSQIDNDILWNTRRLDEVSGFYLYKYRHYSAELGRWLSRDPIEERGGVHLYAFVGNDPIGRWDRLGLALQQVWSCTSRAKFEIIYSASLKIRYKGKLIGDENIDSPAENKPLEGIGEGSTEAIVTLNSVENLFDNVDTSELENNAKALASKLVEAYAISAGVKPADLDDVFDGRPLINIIGQPVTECDHYCIDVPDVY